MIGHMSYGGAISLNAQVAMARAAKRPGRSWAPGEGGLHAALHPPYQDRMIVQVASGRFGVNIDYLERGAAIEIKIGQGGAKPGIGGHLPGGEKVCADISRTRMIPEGGSDAISPRRTTTSTASRTSPSSSGGSKRRRNGRSRSS